jgi:exosortase E/protease (VPEID-CTERM system)
MRRLPFARQIGGAGVILAEMIILLRRDDLRTLAGDRWFVSGLQDRLVYVPRIGFAVVTVLLLLLLFRGTQGHERLRSGPQALTSPPRSPRWLLHTSQLGAFVAFLLLTDLIRGPEIRSSHHPGPWLIAWAVACVATLVLGGVSLLPDRLSGRLARFGRITLAAISIGVVASVSGYLTLRSWEPLSRLTLEVAHGLLGIFFRETVYRPDELIVGADSFSVRIAPTCSGYEGIGLIWVFLGVYLWVSRRDLRFPQALLLLPLGTAFVWLANAIRIAALVAVGVWVSPTVALDGFHSNAGWLAFNLVGLGMIAASRRLRWFAATDPSPVVIGGSNPDAAFLAPAVATLATAMITGAFSRGFDGLYPLRVIVAAVVLWACRRTYICLRLTWSWQAVAIGIGAFALWLALEPAPSGSATESRLPDGLAGLPMGLGAAWVIFRVIGSVITVPLAEELAFRGYLTRRLIAADFLKVPLGLFTWSSFLASSFLFGILHGRWLAGTLAGMLYAVALYRRRELSDAVLAHATTNALISADVLMTGSWTLWD